jgi:hypothetical protein
MGFVFVIALIFVGGPLARAIARSIERGNRPLPGSSPADGDMRRLLQASEQRLTDSEIRLAALEDRLDFYEKLLSNPASSKPTSSSGPVPPSSQS